MHDLHQLLSRLVTAFHILHHHQVFDEDGSISVRNPQDPSTFFTSDVPSIVIASQQDIEHRNVAGGTPVDRPFNGCRTIQQSAPNSEHFLHSSIYNLYPGVQSIVHSPSSSTMIFGLCKASVSMLQPLYQQAGFIGFSTPIFDVAHHYHRLHPSHPHNLAINHQVLGDALAARFSSSRTTDMLTDGTVAGAFDLPDHPVLLQRGHGFVTWATSLEEAIYRAVHVHRSAVMQAAAMIQRENMAEEIVYLDEREVRDCSETVDGATDKVWRAWSAEVERSPKYKNETGLPLRRG
jgi:ribulose-5-phosphate 4-epimerase/fuculose-1-phosphate aldolase